jgi:signal transduction histidine kinase/DNA-binding response OmpR family regulator
MNYPGNINAEIYYIMIFYAVSLYVVFLADVFHKRRKELAKIKKTLEVQNTQLKELDKQKTNFFQNISHELRTPLTLIMTPLEEIKTIIKDNNYVDLAIKNVNRLYRLVNQLLDFQKISSKKKEIELVPIDLIAFLKTCAGYFKASCDKKNIRFSLKIKTNKNIFILGDVDSLEKVIFNYLSNALKYTQGGFISIEVEEENGYAIISVVDSGVGIKNEDHEKLFKVFSQVDESSSREFEGTGLGLALVKELAEKMNGEVGVESGKHEMGSKFWVKFKIATTSEQKILDVLFIDDDEDQIQIFKRYMEKELPHISYKSVDRVRDAREHLNNNMVKCVLSDAIMPEEDGLSFLSWVSSKHPKTTKVLVTGHANTKLLEKAINESHIDHIIHKPWQTKEFKEKISNFVRTSKLHISPPADLKNFTPKDWLIEEQTQSEVEVPENHILNGGSKELILVVDDLKDMRDLISRIFIKHGFRVFTAINGEDALDKIKDRRPDIIITDWMMPKVSGLDLINNLKADKTLSGIPAILLTSKSDEESKTIGVEFGADGFIGKPFSEMELISVVNNNLRLKKREREVEILNYNLSQNILKRYIPNDELKNLQDGQDIFSEKSKYVNVCVLNLDIPGFSDICNELGMKNSASILNDFLSTVSEIINKNGGLTSKMNISEVMAIFGYSKKYKEVDNVNMAISSIEELCRGIESLNDKYNLKDKASLNPRYVLHYGNAQTGFFGGNERTEFMAIGNSVEKAVTVKNKISAGDIIYTMEVLQFLDNPKWENAKRIKLDGFAQNETFFKFKNV